MFSTHITKNRIQAYQTRINQAKSNDIPKQRNLSPVYKPKTNNQIQYVQHLNNPNTSIVLGIGPAGCGKTLFACITAIDYLKRGKIDKIILTRPIVPVEEEELGFLPGSLISKMDPWTKPIIDILTEFYTPSDISQMLKNSIIEVTPLAYMRGRTFKNCFIIADEMQNSTPNQMLMLTTRLGTNSKMVITGDLKQSDRHVDNGLLDLMNKIEKYEKNTNTLLNQTASQTDDTTINKDIIKMVKMKEVDIERSPIVKFILDIYKKDNMTNVGQPVKSTQQPGYNFYYDKFSKGNENDKHNDAAMIPKNQYREL